MRRSRSSNTRGAKASSPSSRTEASSHSRRTKKPSRVKVAPPWSVYVVRCADSTLYTGIASDVERRIAEHLKANGKGSKYLRGRGPLELVFVQGCRSRGAALSLESQMKKLSRAEKEEVIQCGKLQP
jgi:putative endonuclease